MFEGAYSFNGDPSAWDTSKVYDMYHMFYDASKFNRDLSRWDVSNVTKKVDMFCGAFSFEYEKFSPWGWNWKYVTCRRG